MSDDTQAVADQLEVISASLADLALHRLWRASESFQAGEPPDPALVAEEKRITRARRAVDKAVQLLAGASGPAAAPVDDV
ncbi:MAG TPA: hypothetical protein VG014_05890 [Acidimicrobiales bacterium]|nr:hypothetical protein [Acidimicrobiales bacterium]